MPLYLMCESHCYLGQSTSKKCIVFLLCEDFSSFLNDIDFELKGRTDASHGPALLSHSGSWRLDIGGLKPRGHEVTEVLTSRHRGTVQARL